MAYCHTFYASQCQLDGGEARAYPGATSTELLHCIYLQQAGHIVKKVRVVQRPFTLLPGQTAYPEDLLPRRDAKVTESLAWKQGHCYGSSGVFR